MVLNGLKYLRWSQVGIDGLRWSKMVLYCLRWKQMVLDEMIPVGQIWLKNENGLRWSSIVQDTLSTLWAHSGHTLGTLWVHCAAVHIISTLIDHSENT